MDTELVRIGPLLLSKVVFYSVLPLISVLVGGLITYLTMSAIEARKWKQQKNDRLQEQKREALAGVMEWISPMRLAVYRAQVISKRFLQNEMNESELYKTWPQLLRELARMDIPLRSTVLLPSSVQEQSSQVLSQLEELQSFVVTSKPKGKTAKEEWLNTFRSRMQLISALYDTLRAFEQQVIDDYKRTYQ